MNKLFAFFIILLSMSCAAEIPVDPATLRIGMGAEPDTLNPITSSDAYSSQILNYVNDSLIERNKESLLFEPKLAASWEISSNHLQYTFRLRTDVVWHDGHAFTANDVIYSFERIQDPHVAAPFLKVYYADIERAEKINDFAVRFIFKKPYFLGLSICGGIPIVPKHIYEKGQDFNSHPANRHPIGTGPYRFDEWQTNKKITLVRNEHYWGEQPEIKKIVFRIIADDTISLHVLKKGELDMASVRPIQWVRQTDSEKFKTNFNKYKYLLPGYNYIGWNAQNPLFADKRVRQAMTLAINRKKILEKIQFGLGEITESPFFIDSPQFHTGLKTYPYDPQEARRLLAEAGWKDTNNDGVLDKNGKKFAFNFLYPASSKFTERMVTILKEDLSHMGIEMSIERMEWAAFLDRLGKRQFDATSLGWSTSFEGDPYQLWHSSQALVERGSNFVSFKNKRADQLIEMARVEFNEEQRNALYREFQEIIHQEQPYTFLFVNYSLVAISKRFKNVQVHKAGLDPLEWKLP